MLSEPNDIVLLDGNMFITDTNNNLIRLFDPASDRLSTFRFTNEEVLWPKPERAFKGAQVAMPPVTITPGEGSVHLRILPPEGHQWNVDAPNHLAILVDDGPLEVLGLPVDDWSWDFEIPIKVGSDGTGSLRFQVVAYFCEEDDQEFCRFAALELIVPVTVDGSGPPTIDVKHKLDFE
jgi:hypothetical protein